MTPTLQMLQAVNAVIDKARSIHDGIPEVTVVLGASGKMRKGQKHGHFAPKAWVTREWNPEWVEGEEALQATPVAEYGEVLLSGESLQRGAVATVGTILHELAHAYNHANEIKDTSNGNRYHNKRFKETAEEFGLTLTQADVIGWSLTAVPETTQGTYAAEIQALEEAITQYRVNTVDVAISKPQKKFMGGCSECGDGVQVTKGWADRNAYRFFCQEHGTPMEFWVEEPDV